MNGVDFITNHRNVCISTMDLRRLVLLGWGMNHVEPQELPWLWIEPSTPTHRGLSAFQASLNMRDFLHSLSAWFDVQTSEHDRCSGQVMFQSLTTTPPSFEWLVPSSLVHRRQHATSQLREQSTIATWWATLAQNAPLWFQCMLGWERPNLVQEQLLKTATQAMISLLPLWTKKTQAYYASIEQSSLSWSIPLASAPMLFLGMTQSALEGNTLSMAEATKVQLLLPWRTHAPVLMGLLDLQGHYLSQEYGIAEIPHDFLINSMLHQKAPMEYLALPTSLLD